MGKKLPFLIYLLVVRGGESLLIKQLAEKRHLGVKLEVPTDP